MRRIAMAVILLGVGAMLLPGCGGQESTGGAETGVELVQVGDRMITQSMVDEELNAVPPFQRREFESPDGQRKFLERLVEMELLYLAAVDEGLAEDPAMQQEFERARRQILMRLPAPPRSGAALARGRGRDR